MNLTAAVTITVYFVGLVNFSPHKTDSGKREVVAPLAIAEIDRTVGMDPPVTLKVHQPTIVISGVPEAQCTQMEGTWDPTDPDSHCRIVGKKGRFITLPAGTPSSLEVSGHKVPRLKGTTATPGLCSAITGIKNDYLTKPENYAVRLTLGNGTLDTCKHGLAWGSRLTLIVADGSSVKVEDKIANKTVTLTLNSDTTIHISNGPPTLPATSGKEHFWWHYVIAENATGCKAEPTDAATGDTCPAAFIHSDHSDPVSAATGLGCSNSQYP